MRWFVSIGAVLAASLMASGDVAVGAAPGPQVAQQRAETDANAVDVQLILAVDVSYSMDMDELAIQREGYAQAIVSKDFLQALEDRSERQGRRDLFRMGRLDRPEDHHPLAGDRRARKAPMPSPPRS